MSRHYAINYPQLMHQAIRSGYDHENLLKLKRAHDFAVRLYDGFYRGQGIPFLNHLVRVASIVMAENSSVEAVMAALHHSAYIFGQFKDRKQGGCTAPHRKEMVSGLDEKTEEMIYLYDSTLFRTSALLNTYLENIAGYPEVMKTVLLMRLANELEDYMDLGMAFRGKYPYREIIEKNGKLVIELARRLGRPQLASELDEAFVATLASELPEAVKTHRHDAFELPRHRDWRRGALRTTLSRIRRKIRRDNKT